MKHVVSQQQNFVHRCADFVFVGHKHLPNRLLCHMWFDSQVSCVCVCADYVFTEHKRSVNRVVFHSVEANQLLSGSQDGTMKLHVCLVD